MCGNIASGKSTFISMFDKNNTNVVFEEFEKNIFLQAFYKNPIKYSFETELNFLLQHYNSIKDLPQNNTINITDFSILLDRAYADVTLTSNRHKLFNQLADELESEIGLPSKIIYLNCPEKILLKRIKNRNRNFEDAIDIEYLISLNKAIKSQIQSISNKVEIITIDSNKIDFIQDINAKEITMALF